MNGFMPESIRIRKSKIGFSSPMQAWIEKPLKSLILDSVHSQGFIESPIWDGVEIRDKITLAYETGSITKVRQFWSFVQAYILIQSFNSFSELKHSI